MSSFRTVISIVLFFTILVPGVQSSDLADLFSSGRAVIDTGDDNLADRINAWFDLPDYQGNGYHIAAAAELAARLGFESLGASFPLTERKPGAVRIRPALLTDVRTELAQRVPEVLSRLGERSGAVIALSADDILIVGADGPSLHFAAAQFAARWPQAWEIWGDKRSTRLSDPAQHLRALCRSEGLNVETISLRALVYHRSPEVDKNPDQQSREKRLNLDNMRYDDGEVAAAILSIRFADTANAASLPHLLSSLREDHLQGRRVNILNFRGIAETVIVTPGQQPQSVPRFGRPARQLQRRPDPRAMRPDTTVKGNTFDLADLFTTKGIYTDTVEDSLPDHARTTLLLPAESAPASAVDLAARISIESAGVSLPLCLVDARLEQVKELPHPIVIGSGPAREYLISTGKVKPDAFADDHGWVLTVPDGFNESTATVLGGDSAGLQRITSWMAETWPYVEPPKPLPGLSRLDLETVSRNSRRMLAGTSSPGHYAGLIQFLHTQLPHLKRRALESLTVEAWLNRPMPGYENMVARWLTEELGELPITVSLHGRRDPQLILEEQRQWQWEVDAFKELFSSKVLPLLASGQRLILDVRLSEPREVLDALQTWITGQMQTAGIEPQDHTIRILCAYKQGFHWLKDEILPRMKAGDIRSLTIRFRPADTGMGEIRRFYQEQTRWLSELYPIDEIIAAELGPDFEGITFELDASLEQTYAVHGTDAGGNRVDFGTFTPRTVTRTYLDAFPEWASVQVQTGGVVLSGNDNTLFDERIPTDPERIWDDFQSVLLSKAQEHVLEITGKKPTRDKQPFFHTMQVEAWLSEPDYRLGVDEELVSSIESLHEDIYFGGLDFFNGVVPRKAEKLPENARYLTRINAPGSIIPLIHPGPVGQAPRAVFTLKGFASPKARAKLTWVSAGHEEHEELEFKPVKVKNLRVSGLTIDARGNTHAVVSADLPDSDAIAAFARSMPLFQVRYVSDVAGELFPSGILDTLTFDLKAEDAARQVVFNNDHAVIADVSVREAVAQIPGRPIVGHEKIIDPERAAALALHFGREPGVRTWLSGTSYHGIDVYSMEITAPSPSTHISRPRLIAAKPTILIVGRQHANEVSSTTHILSLAENLATNPDFAEYRQKLNIILHPMENPDGARLMETLIKLNPYHMNHAARYTSLGTDLGTQTSNPETLLTEALVRPALWERWKPDIFLNCHGYPSHEWVQQFSGYAPYMFRDYWIPRGWFVYVTHLDDPRYPDHRAATQALLRYIDQFLMGNEEQKQVNARIYDRYWRWAGRWQPHIVNYELHGDTMIYADRTSSRASSPTPRREITMLEQVPEAMDETPGPEWMQTVVRQGLYYLEAHLRLLADAETTVERIEEEVDGRIHRTLVRRRPVEVKPEPQKDPAMQ